jgi:O-antigen/teichoic acid export membrane protein
MANLTQQLPQEQIHNELRTIAKSGSWDGVLRVFAFGLSFIVSALLARIAGVEAIGSVAVTLSALSMLQLLPGMGLGLGILRKTPFFLGKHDYRNASRVVILSYRMSLLAAASIVIIYFLALRPLAHKFLQSGTGSLFVFDVLMIIFPFMSLLPLQQATFTALQKTYKVTQYDQIIRNVIRLTLTFVLAFAFSRVTSLVVGTAAGIATSFGVQALVVRREFGRLGGIDSAAGDFISEVRPASLLAYSLPLMVVPLLTSTSREFDFWIVGYYLTAKDAGVYAIVRIIGGMLMLPLLIYGEIFGVSISKLISRHDQAGVRSIFAISAKWIGLISGLGFILIFSLSSDLLRVFGPDYVAGSLALKIFAFGQLILGYFGATGTLLLMVDQRRLLILNGAASLVLNTVLSMVLTPRFGLLGAALANTLTYTITSLVILAEVILIVKVAPGSLLTFLKRIMIILVGIGMTYSSAMILGSSNYLVRLTISSLAGLIGSSLLVYWWEGLDQEEKRLSSLFFLKLMGKSAKYAQ